MRSVLRELEAREWLPPAEGDAAESGAPHVTRQQLVRFALEHQPALAAARRRTGVATALLAEAGRWPDVEIGWDAMDALAAEVEGEGATSVEYLAGLSVSIPLLRPGERSALRERAAWHEREARWRLTEAEWRLAFDVHAAAELLREARKRLAQNAALAEVASTTRDYFARARAAGVATAIQANLAIGELLAIRAERVRLEANERLARQHLNALLGLPPRAVLAVELAPTSAELAAVEALAAMEPEALVDLALRERPDLAALLALHGAAEEEVRLAVARQLPRLSIGTAFSLAAGLFSRFHRAEVDTAIARRAEIAARVAARVHEIRRDVHESLTALEESQREVAFVERELLPNAEESLRLADDAFDVGEVTLLEILDLQRSLVDARSRHTAAEAELARRRWKLLAATGRLLPRIAPPHPNEPEETR